MAGSRRSPVLRGEWSASDQRDPRDRDRRRGRGFNRDRGRNRHHQRGRPGRPHDRHLDRGGRSPPPSHNNKPRFRRDPSHDPDDFALNRSSARASPGPSPPGFHNSRRSVDNPSPSAPGDRDIHPPLDREAPSYWRDESPFGPPPKRKRTRSPSLRGHRSGYPHSHQFTRHEERRDRSPPYQKRGGRFPGRGARRGSPRRGRDRRGKDGRRPDIRRPARSRSPVRERWFPSPDRRSRSPAVDDYSDHDSHYRSPSRHSARSVNSRLSVSSRISRGEPAMNPTQPIQSMADGPARSPSPPRPIPSFDADNARGPGEGPANLPDAFPMHGMRAFDPHSGQRHRPSRAHTYTTSPQYATPTSGQHGSPPPGSPYSGGRGNWVGQPPYSGPPRHSSPYWQNNYSSQNAHPAHYYQNNHHGPFNGPSSHRPESPYGPPPYRGGHSGHRGNYANHGPDRRYSSSGSHLYNNGPSQRGARANFSNLQWTASGSRGRGGRHSPPPVHSRGSQTPSTRPPSVNDPLSPRDGEPFGPSKIPPQEENGDKPMSDSRDAQDMPPPALESDGSTSANKGGKFSFAFKSKAAPAPAPKPVPDLAQRMQPREPPPRVPEPPPRNKLSNGPLPNFKPDSRFDRRDRDRDRGRDRDQDRRDFRGPRDFRDPRDRRDDRRFDQRRDRRKDRRSDFRPERADRRRELSPEPPREPPPKQTKVLLRPKPRPTFPDEFAHADSVYYRKPGNESVIGAGTYGKVFKGVHVYTQRQVALKKIRMEGEKDGFPVTAVREIKLLQHLRHDNVVSLLEVMVEKNECFMVFEYLSHDLTGLINHPTFTLTLAHKKDLAKQMFEGLNYLHHRGVLHRDIKAANILISNRGLLKFADFGLARFFSKSRQLDYTNRVITIWYRPPELLLGETRYGPAVDVWSAACVCMEMFNKKAVFPGEGGELSQMDKLYNCLGTPTRADWPDVVEMPWFQLMRPTERKKRHFEDLYRDLLTPAALDLISQIFRYDPSKRPSAEEVLQHPYFVSEEPTPQPPIELEHIEGDWHEFESKALRKEARRAEYQSQKEREKRKAETTALSSDREPKRARPDEGEQASGSVPG